jgi:ankyrin repeat protein
MRFSGHIARALLATVALGSQPAVHADSPLADLIQNGRRAEALRLIDSDGDVNRVQSDGTTPLHWAVYREDPALVDRLLEAGADPSVTNRYGSSPLAEAVKIADAALVETLLEAGADPEAVNADGQTALMLAARTGSVDVAKHLIEHGAEVNAEESFRGQTALMWAVDGNFADLATYLVEEGADVTTRAAVNDWPAQITSEPRAQYRPTGGLTPLLFAARSGCLDCIRAIVGAGENIDRPTPEGVTPLMLAIDNMNFAAANLLLDLGANPYYSDWWGRTALYLAVDMNSYPAGVEEAPVPEAGADGRGGNSQRFTDDLLTTGATPLLRAAITHDHEVMRLLLEHGARVDLPNVMGVTPLMAAAGLGVREPGFGSNRAPHFDSDPRIEDKVIGSLEILLAAGADINARVTDTHSRTARIARPSQLADREGQTALFRAAGRGWARVVEYMLEHGARADVTDMLGHTARDAAMGRLASGAPVFEDVAAALGD